MKTRLQEQSLSQEKTVKESVHEALREKDRELEQANRRVIGVEEEMKQVLAESGKERGAMEAKFLRLSKAFNDMQKELT